MGRRLLWLLSEASDQGPKRARVPGRKGPQEGRTEVSCPRRATRPSAAGSVHVQGPGAVPAGQRAGRRGRSRRNHPGEQGRGAGRTARRPWRGIQKWGKWGSCDSSSRNSFFLAGLEMGVLYLPLYTAVLSLSFQSLFAYFCHLKGNI